MTDTIIHRPRCHHAIPLTEALSTQLREQMEASLRAEHETRLQQVLAEAIQRKQAVTSSARRNKASSKASPRCRTSSPASAV